MRSWYVNRRNDSILNARVMGLFAAALVLILVWLLPREQTFRAMLASQEADRVSIAYARLLLGISPEDAELRQLLAGQYYQIGELDNAWAVLKDNGGSSTVLGIQILHRLTYTKPVGKERTLWQAKLLDAIERAATADHIQAGDLAELARAAEGLNRPRLAAGLRERLYTLSGLSGDLRNAAQAWIAADAPGYAAKLLLRDGAPISEELIKLTIRAALAANDTELSLSVVDSYFADNAGTAAPSTDLIAHFTRVFLAANKASRVPELLALLPPSEQLTLKESTEFASAAVASGQLALAKQLMERALSIENDDAELIGRLAQVYEWSGQPEDALDMWLRASESSPAGRGAERAWRISKDLYHYHNVANLLSKMSESKELTDEEVAVLKLAWEQHGDPVAGEQVLLAYVKREPQHRQAWQELIALQTNNLRFKEADEAWQNFNLHHSLTIAENQLWADIKWRRFRAREAMDVLLLREPMSGNTAYWRQLAAYAWFLDEPAIASRAMEARLAMGETLNIHEMGQLIQGSTLSNPEMVAVHAASAWEKNPEHLEFLLTALYAEIEAGNRATAGELFDRALANTEIASAIEASAAFWTLRANHLQQLNDPAGAQQALSKALSLEPTNPELQAGQLWFDIAAKDTHKVRQSVAILEPTAAEKPALWTPLASAYALLQEHRKASIWFNRALQINTTDVGLLLAYSGTLEALGWRDPAYRLRRHTLKLLAAQSAKRQAQSGNPQVDADTVIAASRDIISGPQQRALLQRLLAVAPLSAGQPQRATPLAESQVNESDEQRAQRLAVNARFELSDALRREHYSSARYWLNAGAQASTGDRLAIAADEYDEQVLAGLALDDNYEVSSQAALALGQPGFAMNKTLDELRKNPRNRAAVGLRESLSRELRPSGWQVSPVMEKLGNFRFSGADFLLSRRFERFHLDTRLRQQDATVKILQGKESFSETSVDTKLSYANRWGPGSVELGLTVGEERSFAGINWQQEFQIDRRNSLTLALEHNARMQGGGVAQALLSRTGARLDWNSALSARLQLNSSVMTSTYKDQNQNSIGDVTQVTISPNYVLARSGPTINLRGQAQWVQSSEQRISQALAEFLRSPDQEVLPGDTRSLSIGGVIQRDRPGELDWQRSGAHYRISADVGYRWPQQNLTFNSEAAIGVPVFGRDRLTAAAVFTNSLDNEVSETGVRAQLTYSRRIN